MAWEPASDLGKFGNPYLRWSILYGLVIIVLTLLPLWGRFMFQEITSLYINACFIAWFNVMWVAISLNAVRNFSKLGNVPVPGLEALAAARARKFTHAVIVPCYLDPIDVLFDCLGSLLMQKNPASLFVVVTFEAKTPDLKRMVEAVTSAFDEKFGHFICVIHTVLKDKEIAGGCSNKNFALREMTKYLNAHPDKFGGHAVTISTCDTDSLFHPNYFEVLELCYNGENPSLKAVPKMCVWQSPLFYNWDLDERPFFNRITGIMRSMMMLGGLISFNLNPMSIFSYPLELGLKAGFINPRYGMLIDPRLLIRIIFGPRSLPHAPHHSSRFPRRCR